IIFSHFSYSMETKQQELKNIEKELCFSNKYALSLNIFIEDHNGKNIIDYIKTDKKFGLFMTQLFMRMPKNVDLILDCANEINQKTKFPLHVYVSLYNSEPTKDNYLLKFNISDLCDQKKIIFKAEIIHDELEN